MLLDAEGLHLVARRLAYKLYSERCSMHLIEDCPNFGFIYVLRCVLRCDTQVLEIRSIAEGPPMVMPQPLSPPCGM